jgi:hypothetical protein
MNKLEIQVSYDDLQDMKKFCEINNIELDALLKKSFKTGYNIEKYGLLGKTGGEQEKWVEKEVIVEKRVEVPVEVIREVEKVVEKIIEVPIEIVKEIPVEKVVVQEIIKEIPVEKIVTKVEYISDNSQVDEMAKKINDLESEKKIFSTKIEELEEENKKFSTIIKEKENIFQNNDRTQQLQTTIQTLMGKIRERDKEITELKEQIKNTKNIDDDVKPAVYLRSSNLGDNLYKE